MKKTFCHRYFCLYSRGSFQPGHRQFQYQATACVFVDATDHVAPKSLENVSRDMIKQTFV